MKLIHFPQPGRDEILKYFPETHFIGTLTLTPAEGTWGTILLINNEQNLEFFKSLLEKLFEIRYNNAFFKMYEKFPWKHSPLNSNISSH